VSEYAALKKEFVPGFLETISGWIREKEHVAVPPAGANAPPVSAAPAPAAAPAPPVPAPPPAEGSVEARADGFLRKVEKREFAAAAKEFAPEVASRMSAADLGVAWGNLIEQIGALRAVTERKTETEEGYTRVDLTCAFERGRRVVRVVYDGTGKIAGLWFRAAE
jgi:hypothetical protein